MSQLQPPKTPVKQKFRKPFNQRHNVDYDMEDVCDISPTLRTRKGRASLGSEFRTMNMNKAFMSTTNSISNPESGATSNDPSSVQSSELSSDFHELRVPLFYRINPITDSDEHTKENVSILEVDFNSPNVSPTKHGNAVERFVILAVENEESQVVGRHY